MAQPTQGQPVTAVDRDALIGRDRERIRRFATFLGCRDDAEDIAQEVALLLSGKYRGVTDALEIVKLANRICFNLVQNSRRRRRPEELDAGMTISSGGDPETIASDKELKRLMLKAIEGLGSRGKRLLSLRLGGATTEEIAEQLQLSHDAVHTAFFRCIKKLMAALGGAR